MVWVLAAEYKTLSSPQQGQAGQGSPPVSLILPKEWGGEMLQHQRMN